MYFNNKWSNFQELKLYKLNLIQQAQVLIIKRK